MTYISEDRKAELLSYLDERYGTRRNRTATVRDEMHEDDLDRLADDGLLGDEE